MRGENVIEGLHQTHRPKVAATRAPWTKDLRIRRGAAVPAQEREPTPRNGPVELEAYERRFRRAGLPLFIEGWNASADVFTRAVPLLALVFMGELLGALDRDWSLVAEPRRRRRRAGDPARRGFGLLNLAARPPLLRAARTASAASSSRSS